MGKQFQISRRTFLRGSLAVVGAGAVTGLYSWQVEPRWVLFERRTLPIPNLPEHLIGRTLVQISDIHVGDRYDWSYQYGALQKVVAIEPDFVVYTGDFVSYETAVQLNQLDELLTVAPLGRLGTAAVLGNHDYGHGWRMADVADQIAQRLAQRGITVLRNEVQLFDGLQLVGIDDFWGPNYNPQFMSSLDPTHPSIVLCHNPDVVDEPIWGAFEGWILSGHTHGGQVKPPFLPPPVLPVQNERYTAGAFDLGDGRFLYINRGLGNLWQIRFNVRPEITVFTLA